MTKVAKLETAFAAALVSGSAVKFTGVCAETKNAVETKPKKHRPRLEQFRSLFPKEIFVLAWNLGCILVFNSPSVAETATADVTDLSQRPRVKTGPQ